MTPPSCSTALYFLLLHQQQLHHLLLLQRLPWLQLLLQRLSRGTSGLSIAGVPGRMTDPLQHQDRLLHLLSSLRPLFSRLLPLYSRLLLLYSSQRRPQLLRHLPYSRNDASRGPSPWPYRLCSMWGSLRQPLRLHFPPTTVAVWLIQTGVRPWLRSTRRSSTTEHGASCPGHPAPTWSPASGSSSTSTTPMVPSPATRLARWFVASPSATASTTTRHSARWSNQQPSGLSSALLPHAPGLFIS